MSSKAPELEAWCPQEMVLGAEGTFKRQVQEGDGHSLGHAAEGGCEALLNCLFFFLFCFPSMRQVDLPALCSSKDA